MFPNDDKWWMNYSNSYYNHYIPKKSTFFDELMKVIENVMDNQDVIDRVNIKKSATVKVEKNGKQYKVVVEEIVPESVEPPVKIEIQDDEGNPINDSDKHPDFTE